MCLKFFSKKYFYFENGERPHLMIKIQMTPEFSFSSIHKLPDHFLLFSIYIITLFGEKKSPPTKQ